MMEWFSGVITLWLQELLFRSPVRAVDPVAVIAVFEEINVNETLFITVFGEALFNDGITVVLYQMFRKFVLIGRDKLIPIDYLAGGISFFVIGLGGTAIGLFYAFIVSFITKYTDKVKILNPIFIFLIPYMAYLTGEIFGLSSILAIVACGMTMKQYVKGNITTTAATSVKYFIKMLAQICETVIFMFLGLSTISSKHHWDLPFIALTIIFCLVYRTIGVIIQCAILNRFRKQKFTRVDQFVLCYGGLRGAIAFGLVVSMPNNIHAKSMFTTACIAVIYFTVFLQGITIRPLATFLNIERETKEGPTMIQSVYMRYFDYTMAGVEDIAGQKGYNSIRDAFERLNATIFRPLLMRNQKPHRFDASKIIRAYTKITLKEAIEMASDIGPSINVPRKAQSVSETIAPSAYNNLEYLYDEKSNMNDSSNLRTEIAKYMTSSENTEALYRIFSQLLDRKLFELKKNQEAIEDNGDDIKEDYMAEFMRPGTSVSTVDLTNSNKYESRSVANVFSNSIRRRRRVARSQSMGNYI
ncbi:putative Na(+)/H(+) antiporter nhx-9 [Dirofilaria immitis]